MGDPGGAAVLLRFLRIQGFLCLFLLPQTGSVLEVTAPSPHVAQKGSDTLIPCTFRVNKFPADPKFLAIYWDFNGRRILTYDNVVSTTDPRFSLDPNSAPRGEASLSVSNAQISDGGTYSCSVTYSPEQQQKEIIVEIQAPPQITITNRVVTENKESALRASIIGFYPQDLDVTWLRDGAILRGVTVNKPQRDPDGTYSTTSAVTIVPTEGNRNQNFSIRVQHESLTAPLQKNFQLLYAAAPSIHISHGPFYVNEEQTLMCRVWGYYPEDIAVSWFLDGSWVEPSEIKRINSSALELPYRFLPTAESQGMEISCVVEHWALTEPLVQSLKVELTDAQWSNTLIIIIIIIIIITIFAVALVAAVLFLKKKKRCCIRTGNREDVKGKEPTTPRGSESKPLINSTPKYTAMSTESDKGHQESSQDPSGEQDGDLNPDTVTERNEPRCPIFGKIHSSQKGNFFLEIKDFYPREMKVEWTGSPGSAGEERVTLRSDLLYTGENDNGTYNVISTCGGAGEKVNMNDMYTLRAQVQHQSLQSPQEVTLQQGTDKSKLPTEASKSGAPDTEEGGEDSEQTGLVGSQTDKETQQCPPIEENMADNGEQEPESSQDPSGEQDGDLNPDTVTERNEPRCPIFGKIHSSQKGNFFLEIKDFYPREMKVEWTGSPGSAGEERVTLRSDLLYTGENDNRTYNVISTCVGAGEKVNMNDMYTLWAQVQHQSLQLPHEVTLQQAKPKVKIEQSPAESGIRMICTLERFYPGFVEIRWLSAGKNVKSPNKEMNKKITRNNDGTFSARSEKVFSERELELGVRVIWEHESLAMPECRDLPLAGTDKSKLPTEASKSGAPETEEGGEDSEQTGLVGSQTDKETQQCPPIEENMADNGEQEPGTDKSKLPTEASKSGAPETEEGGEDSEQTGLVGSQTDRETQQCPPIEENMADNGEQEPEEQSSEVLQDQEESETGPREKRIPNSPVMEEQE
uniref:Ig-like domain-containing protein n=1 Tax=Xenopus tropicalis TaxID=8364 RepID=A0A803K8H1_XENTR